VDIKAFRSSPPLTKIASFAVRVCSDGERRLAFTKGVYILYTASARFTIQ